MGLDIFLADGNDSINEASSKHPEHYCNKGYLLSSYNEAGFNSVANQLVGKDLYYIFQPIEPVYTGEEDEEDSFYVPYPKEHLKEALIRAKEVTKALKEAPPYRVTTISATNAFSKEENKTRDQDAIAIFRQQLEEKNGHSFGNFRSKDGHFFLQQPIEVAAMIPGIDLFGAPAIHMVYKSSDSLEDYIQQAEIIEEFIEKALTLEDPRIGWSS